ILAEESGREHGARDSEYVWIIDPLDGTTNFLHGFPVYAVSIALAYRGQVQQAVVYDPTRNDLFFASKGRGAFLNDRRLRVSKRTRLSDALIGTGFPFRKGDNFKRYVKMFEEVMQSCAGLRRPGAAALDLCYVAAGYYDGFFETGLQPWDAAAGSLIITEAGGLIGNFTGESDYLYQREVVAGNPKVYGQLVQILAPYTRVIKEEPAADSTAAPQAAAPDATQAFVQSAAEPPARVALRVRKAVTPGEDDAPM
ncbi:MAG: inositol monophosphatase family protein, partial [Rubrivivax sp.]|nr:inositol monophosphatase family protein [Rubrivivax sp.]